MTPSRWLLLGGDGFVGRHLARELRRSGAHVRSIDRDDGDLRARVDPGWFVAADAVVLLAGVVRSPSDDELMAGNVEIALRVADAYAASATGPPLFFLSSLHVYATSAAPVDARAPTRPPRSSYGAVKLACETLLAEAAVQHGFPLWIGRAGNLVARDPPINPSSFVADMRAGLAQHGRIMVRNSPRRDVVWIADLASGLARRLRERPAPGRVHVENVCTGNALDLARVAELAVEIRRARGERSECVATRGGPDILVGVPSPDRVWGDGPTHDEMARLIAGD